MLFRIINYDDIVDKDDFVSKFEYVGVSNIDQSQIYNIDFFIYENELLEKMFSRDFQYLNTINRKNKLNKLVKNDKINIGKQFINFYLKNKDNVFLIKLI